MAANAIFGRTWHDTPITAGSFRRHGECKRCAHHPAAECAACSAPAVVALDCGEHAMSLCAACYTVVLSCRASALAEKEQATA